MSRKARTLSAPAAEILRRFLVPGAELYGFEIIRETGIPSGTLYPALRLLTDERRFLTSEWEDIDPVAEQRPRRRLYRLIPEREPVARAALEEHAELKQNPRGSRIRVRPEDLRRRPGES